MSRLANISSVLGIIGIVLWIIGKTAKLPWMITIGTVLVSPLIFISILLIVIAIPVTVILNLKDSHVDWKGCDVDQAVREDEDEDEQ